MTEETSEELETAAEAPEASEEIAKEDAQEVAEETEEASEDKTDAPERVAVHRQSLVLRNGSCDMRVGQDVIDLLGSTLRQVAGKPRRTLVVYGPEVSPELIENCRRSLVDTGYDVRMSEAPSGRVARSTVFVAEFMETMAEEGITADDPVLVIGDGDLISGVLYVTSTWYGGCVLAAVPTTLDAMVEVLPTPRYIDTPSAPNALYAKGSVRLALCDVDLLPVTAEGEAPADSTLMGRAVMVASAMVSGKTAFSDLAIATDTFLANEPQAMTDVIMSMSKVRSRTAASSALAMRQSVVYGFGIARALGACIAEQEADPERYLVDKEPCSGRLLAEGMRIAARLGAAYKPDKPELVDLVFTQDGLLEKFGLDEIACVVEPELLLAKLREVEFARQNRFMPAIPLDYGRIRMTSLDEDLVAEHVAAWCKSRRKLARRRFKESK